LYRFDAYIGNTDSKVPKISHRRRCVGDLYLTWIAKLSEHLSVDRQKEIKPIFYRRRGANSRTHLELQTRRENETDAPGTSVIRVQVLFMVFCRPPPNTNDQHAARCASIPHPFDASDKNKKNKNTRKKKNKKKKKKRGAENNE